MPATKKVISAEEIMAEKQRAYEEKQRIHEAAIEAGRKDQVPTFSEAVPDDAKRILFHFLESGFSAWGSIWSEAQEIEVVIGSDAYKETFDRNGDTWLDIVDKPGKQRQVWGKVFIASGPWEGKIPWEDNEIVEKAERKRDRRPM